MTEQGDLQGVGSHSGPSTPVSPDLRQEHPLSEDVQRAGDALLKLGLSEPQLATTLARLIEAVTSEATRTSRFARSLGKALADPQLTTAGSTPERPKRPSRRSQGAIDPFSVFAESGEDGLRSRLKELDLEQLRDIIAEHGMDHDRLAMKWKDPQRVLDRIVERVEARATKGSAFRGRSGPMTP